MSLQRLESAQYGRPPRPRWGWRRRLLMVLAILWPGRRGLVALGLLGVASVASAAPFELTGGGTDRPISTTGPGSTIVRLVANDFAFVGSIGSGGVINPSGPYGVGSTLVIDGGWLGGDFTGAYTLHGVTVPVGLISPTVANAEFHVHSAPFTVPGLTATPTVMVPFTVTGGIGATLANPAPGPWHGEGVMTFTFLQPVTLPAGPVQGDAWMHGEAQWLVQTPEPSTLLLVGTALAGVGAWAWRRRKGA